MLIYTCFDVLNLNDEQMTCKSGSSVEHLQLRGALRGATRPVNLAALSKSLDFMTAGSSGKMVQSTVEELLSEGAVFGTVKANTFVPSIYASAQQQAVQDFYNQNGFIEYFASP